MDPNANLERQRELAQQLSDWSGDLGLDYVELVEELCSLVQALDGWRRQGGFDPYQIPSDREAARDALLEYMEGVSEARWSASWLSGLEYSLAHGATLNGPSDPFPWFVQQAGGWWTWDDEGERMPNGFIRNRKFIEGTFDDLAKVARG